MAKQLNLTKLGGTAPFADGGLKLSKSIPVSKIEPHELFQSLFDIDEDLLGRITASMKKDGYDPSQPIHIWTQTDDDGTTHSYLVDGYTRLAAAKQVGRETVPFYEHKFKTVDEAHLYAIHLQVDRRNLTDAELMKNIEILMGSEYVKNMKGRLCENIADVLGVSPRTVEKAINVIKNADEETKAEIDAGRLSINKADKETHKKKKCSNVATKNSDSESDDDDISDALSEGNAGNPGSLNFSHSDGHERPNMSPFAENEMDARLIERYKEGHSDGKREGFEKGVSDGAYEVWQKILEMMKDGMTADEIENNEMFEDFTYSVIAPKLGLEYEEEGE